MHARHSRRTLHDSGQRQRGALLMAAAVAGVGLSASAPAAAATFQTIGGEVVIEAESFTREAGSQSYWEQRDALSGFSGDGYMQAGPLATGLQFDPNKRRLEYDITFQQTGTYHVHLRSYAIDHSENGFFATLDGAEVDYADGYYLHVPSANRWAWKARVGGQPGGYDPDPASWLTVQLHVATPGLHTFALYMREAKVRCDLIWLTRHQPTVLPQDAEPSLSDPASFLFEDCANGIDDDDDGQTDCDDSDCDSEPDCHPGTGGAGGESAGAGGESAGAGGEGLPAAAGGSDSAGAPGHAGSDSSLADGSSIEGDGCAVHGGHAPSGHGWLWAGWGLLLWLGRRWPCSRRSAN